MWEREEIVLKLLLQPAKRRIGFHSFSLLELSLNTGYRKQLDYFLGIKSQVKSPIKKDMVHMGLTK